MNVEFRFGDSTDAGFDRDGPQYGYPTGQRLSDYQEWERGEATFVRAPMGPAGLETLDTLIMAGIAATRSEAIRWAMDRFRELPAYERLRERVRDADALKDEFWAAAGSQQPAGTDRGVLAALEREIEDEAKIRFPGGAVSRVRLLQYGDDPEIEPGDLWVRVIPAADGPEDWERAAQGVRATPTRRRSISSSATWPRSSARSGSWSSPSTSRSTATATAPGSAGGSRRSYPTTGGRRSAKTASS